MNQIKPHSMIVIACALVMSVFGGSAWALVGSAPGPVPTCYAKAGRYCSNADPAPCTADIDCSPGFCSAVIFGEATAAVGSEIGSITTSSPDLVISTGGTGTAKTFRVHWDNVGALPFTGTVTATNANGSCTVPVRFTQRVNVAPNNATGVAAVPIIGTGEWAVPTIGEWGMMILSLLLLSASSVLVRQRRFALAASGPVRFTAPPPFVLRLFLRTLSGIGVLGLVALSALVLLDRAPSTTDIVGSLCSAGILAYVVHLWAIPSVGSAGERNGGR